jgi:MFS family permease
MNFYQHTQKWYNGELFEGKMILFFGIIITIMSLLIWKYGTTPNAKSLIIPLLSVGLLFSIGLSTMMINYPKRMTKSELAFKENAAEFILSEKKRVEDFQVLYKYSVGFAAVSFMLTIIAFGFVENRTFQSICIALMLISVSLVIIDHFSKERAEIYYLEIQKQLEN